MPSFPSKAPRLIRAGIEATGSMSWFLNLMEGSEDRLFLCCCRMVLVSATTADVNPETLDFLIQGR